jgi:hypothetical protein
MMAGEVIVTSDEVTDQVKAWWWDMRGRRTSGQFGIVLAGSLDDES